MQQAPLPQPGNPNATQKTSNGDRFDITAIPNDELDQLAQYVENFYKQDGTIKTRLSYSWDRNQRYLDGDHWIVFDGEQGTGGVWMRLNVSRANEYIPRPVTNYVFDAYQTLKSYLIKSKPRCTVRPNTQSFRDKSAAKVAQLCLEANWERLKENQNYEYAASILITYGTVFKKTFWDTTSANMVKFPRMVEQPKLDPETGALMGMEEVQALDEEGMPLFDLLPLGDVNTRVVEPQRIAIDPLCSDLHNAGYIMEYSLQTLDWIYENYNKQEPGYTGFVDRVKPETDLNTSLRRLYQLKSSSGIRATSALEGTNGAYGNFNLTNMAVVKEYYEKPSIKHPTGRLVVVANGVTLYAGDTPCVGTEQGDWHPYSECRWEIVPGRFWGKSPLDNVCELNKHINSIDSSTILTRKTMAMPQKLIPFASGIESGQWTGRAGQNVFYRSGDGSKPEIIPGAGVDSSVFVERAQKVDDIKNISGAIDILKGDRPPGVNAASALSLLYEVGTGKLFPVFDRWKFFVENDQKKELKLIAHKYKEPREDFISLLKSKNSELSEESISKFIGSDLYDNCNVVIEAGSNIPKLEAARQARLEQAALAGTLALDMPANRAEYNEQMGITGFDNDIGPDSKRAEWENDLMDNIKFSPDNRPIVLFVDKDEIHIEIHSRRMKEPNFFEQPQEVQDLYMQHIEEHMEAMDNKRMLQTVQNGGVPPGQEETAPSTPKGKGSPASVNEGIAKADMPPGSVV